MLINLNFLLLWLWQIFYEEISVSDSLSILTYILGNTRKVIQLVDGWNRSKKTSWFSLRWLCKIFFEEVSISDSWLISACIKGNVKEILQLVNGWNWSKKEMDTYVFVIFPYVYEVNVFLPYDLKQIYIYIYCIRTFICPPHASWCIISVSIIDF